jgi:hypothetical protein
MARPKKPEVKGKYRNLQKMEGHDNLWQFDVLDAKNNWHTLTNLGGDSEEIRKEFCQKTADSWVKK